jgi:hypothetical protein
VIDAAGPARVITFANRLRNDRRGLALIEFALTCPLVLMVGLYGTELANLALANMRVSQAALTLADNASRVGVRSGSAQQFREVDVNDVIQGLRLQSTKLDLMNNGRVIISSLETEGTNQRIHWQRCVGIKRGAEYASHYGETHISAGTQPSTDQSSPSYGTLQPLGMGVAGRRVLAPANAGVIFVEVNYQYKPVVATWIVGTPRLHYTASYIVRANRDFSMIFNPVTSPATPRATCDLYNV